VRVLWRYAFYLFANAGLALVSAGLVVLLARHAAPLAFALLPYSATHTVSLMEQRAIDAEAAAKPLPEGARRRVLAMAMPSETAGFMAAQLDAAERAEVPAARHQPKQRFAFDDGISFPPAPRLATLKLREAPRRRVAYAADLRARRFAARAYPSAAEEFRRRFAPSFADAR
jgi:hypothetical protein